MSDDDKQIEHYVRTGCPDCCEKTLKWRMFTDSYTILSIVGEYESDEYGELHSERYELFCQKCNTIIYKDVDSYTWNDMIHRAGIVIVIEGD